MIYFYDELVRRTLETIKEAYDCADVLNDLNRIEQEIANIKLNGNLFMATQLDQEMRKKYPCIDRLIDFANSIPIPSVRVKKSYSANEAIITSLNQDYYGILCDTAIKKQIIQSICFLMAVSQRIP